VNPSIDLPPAAWRWATWRKLPPVPRPARAFDLDEVTERAARARKTFRHWEWSDCEIPPFMSRAEAHYWFRAMTTARDDMDPATHARTLREQGGFTGEVEVDLAAIREGVADDRVQTVPGLLGPARPELVQRDLVRPLASLVPFEEVTDLVFLAGVSRYRGLNALALGLLDLVPWLLEDQVKVLRERCRGKLDPKLWSVCNASPIEFYVAARVGGFEDELLALVETWPDGGDPRRADPRIVFGLATATLVERHMRRLKLKLDEPDYVHAWLAHTETRALDVVRDAILESHKRHAEELATALAAVHAPEAAPHFLELKQSAKAARVARQWLERNVQHAIPGLLPVAAGEGELARAALDFLRTRSRSKSAKLIEKALAGAPDGVAARIRAALPEYGTATTTAERPAWLTLPPRTRISVPAWLDPATLPPVVVSGRPLGPDEVAIVLAALRASTPEKCVPLLAALRENADRSALDAFAWQLYEAWREDGSSPKDKWGLLAVGFLGSDAAVPRLAELVRTWRAQNLVPRAVIGLECLRAIGTDVALRELHAIARDATLRSLRRHAEAVMETIARTRKVTRPELEDRLVPCGGLDEKGSRTFDFGPRQFAVTLGPGLELVVRDGAGELVPDLPKPGVKDDAAKAAEAVAAWKALKKEIKAVAKVQSARLEQAMVTCRRWKREDFEARVLEHPILTHLVRLLVLSGHDAKGKRVATFRIAEDGSHADSKDEPASLARVVSIGIAHPLDLDEDLRARWGQVLGDYRLLPPFPQLGRSVFLLEKNEAKATELHRNDGKKIPAVALAGTLDRLGWERGTPMDGGYFHAHSKPFPGANVTAVIAYPGIHAGFMDAEEEQAVDRCFFLEGIHGPRGHTDGDPGVPLANVHPIAVSEVLKDLATLAEKSR
jgi:hypothetical protein